MGLFDQIVGAISNPQLQTQQSDLGSLIQGLQELAGGRAASEDEVQAVTAALGRHLKEGLNGIRNDPTPDTPESVVSEMARSSAVDPAMLDRIFGAGGGERVAQDVSRQTGVNMQSVLAMLPVILPMLMKLFQSGSAVPSQSAAASPPSGGSLNPILKGFLDSDKDGDVDIQDILSMAGPFLSGGSSRGQ